MRARISHMRSKYGRYVICVSPRGATAHALYGHPGGTPIGIYDRTVPIDTVMRDIENALAEVNRK
ncbi:hypothetical protein [Xanthomonas phage NEB7]|nr:hypothetical protein [Xanthomonas phage NEB7]